MTTVDNKMRESRDWGETWDSIRYLLSILAFVFTSIAVGLNWWIDEKSPLGPLKPLYQFPWVIIYYLVGIPLGIALLWLLFSAFGERHRLVDRYLGFFVTAGVVVGGADPRLYVYVVFWILFVTPISLAAQVTLAIGAGLLCLVGLTALATKSRQRRLLETVDEYGTKSSAALLVVIVTVSSVVVFGFYTYLIEDWGALSTDSATNGSNLDIWTACLFYVYQLVRSLPVINLADAYGWDSPLRSSGPVIGTAIVMFKLTVIGPVIKFLQVLWSHRSPVSKTSPE